MSFYRVLISFIKRFKYGMIGIVLLKKLAGRDQSFGISVINVAKDFPMYWPGSAGTYRSISKQATLAISETIPLLVNFVRKDSAITPMEDFVQRFKPINEERLGSLLSFYGSDKSSEHNYHRIYSHILGEPGEIQKVFEIGLGTNNTKINSNMGASGKPGASIRAFRDYLPNATVYGADIDREVLFKEERISTFYLDQTDQDSFEILDSFISGDFDLMIDDGLHSINANLRSLEFFLRKLRKGGFAVIEDIPEWSIEFWYIVPNLLGSEFESNVIRTRKSFLFIVKKL